MGKGGGVGGGPGKRPYNRRRRKRLPPTLHRGNPWAGMPTWPSSSGIQQGPRRRARISLRTRLQSRQCLCGRRRCKRRSSGSTRLAMQQSQDWIEGYTPLALPVAGVSQKSSPGVAGRPGHCAPRNKARKLRVLLRLLLSTRQRFCWLLAHFELTYLPVPLVRLLECPSVQARFGPQKRACQLQAARG